ncbi:hypothetical protein RYX36_036781 [Vicia faba]
MRGKFTGDGVAVGASGKRRGSGGGSRWWMCARRTRDQKGAKTAERWFTMHSRSKFRWGIWAEPGRPPAVECVGCIRFAASAAFPSSSSNFRSASTFAASVFVVSSQICK